MKLTNKQLIADWFKANNPGTVSMQYRKEDRTPEMDTVEKMMESPDFWAFDEEAGGYIPDEKHWGLIEYYNLGDPDFIVATITTEGVEFEIR